MILQDELREWVPILWQRTVEKGLAAVPVPTAFMAIWLSVRVAGLDA